MGSVRNWSNQVLARGRQRSHSRGESNALPVEVAQQEPQVVLCSLWRCDHACGPILCDAASGPFSECPTIHSKQANDPAPSNHNAGLSEATEEMPVDRGYGPVGRLTSMAGSVRPPRAEWCRMVYAASSFDKGH